MKKQIILVFISILISSCTISKTPCGTFDSTKAKVLYSKKKQLRFVWGLVPVFKNTPTPKDGNCRVDTKVTFLDLILSPFSIIPFVPQMSTVKVYVNKKSNTIK